jgi:uncharacterized protein (TIGR00369 family)
VREAADPAYADRVRASFALQGLMTTLGAELARVDPGVVEIRLASSDGLTQQDGFLHAGVMLATLDSACGYAALTLMQPGVRVLTVELKANLLAPADGERLTAHGEVVRSGRTLTVCRGDAYSERDGARRHVATVLATMIAVAEPAA